MLEEEDFERQQQSEENLQHFMLEEPCLSSSEFLFRSLYHSHSSSHEKVSPNQMAKTKIESMPSKIKKVNKIRTNRNSHKTYHLIVKNWLAENGYEAALRKYATFFNKRVYFLLVLDEVLRYSDGLAFARLYQESAGRVIEKK